MVILDEIPTGGGGRRRLQGNMRRISITCATTAKLVSLSRRSRIRPCSKGTSLGGPQISPTLTHDASRGGGPERKVGGATHVVPLGA